tara:strand:- start:1742 stop:1984 length:243 start_codon:yes stop_codon:yes gene_type:complete
MAKVKTPEVAAKPAPKVNLGGLNPNAIYTATGKVARAAHNADRHKALSGLTVSEALLTRTVNAQDIKYDLKLGFITLVEE